MLSENGNSGFFMPVAPAYSNNGGGFGGGFGGDWGWIILLLLLAGGGWGGGFGGGMFGMDNLYPWINNSQNINEGFRDQMLNDNITSIRDNVYGISTQLCNGFAGVNASISNGFAQSEIAENSRQMANMNQMFNLQSALQNCCCENRANIADLKYTVATENCADRQTINDGVRDLLANQTANTQAVLDKLCALELSSKQDKINDLERQLTMANLAASQVRQTADIQNNIVNELRSCPIPSQPVYGSQPIFTCPNNNNGCGCGCGNF